MNTEDLGQESSLVVSPPRYPLSPTGNSNESRIVPCPNDCDHGWLETTYGFVACSACDGSGLIEIEVEPITLEDLP